MQFVNELIRGADADDIGCFGNRDVQRLVHLRRRRAGASERQQCQNNKFYLHLRRSEEHTSELQSLMRISYAVFCLKKTIIQQTHHLHIQRSNKTTMTHKQINSN